MKKAYFWWFVESPSTVLSCSWTTASCSSSIASSALIAVTLEATEGSEKDAIANDFFEIHMEKGKKEEKCVHPKKSE
jgi:NifU-like protein involved in Fe-S cluster formation